MATTLEQIDKAIGAHGAWKVKLRQAIDGTLTLNAAEVSLDNRCEFGKWLYSIAGTLSTDAHYKDVLALHNAFHKAAGEVATKVQKGNRAGAEADMSLGGAYTTASSKLTSKMMEWKRAATKAA